MSFIPQPQTPFFGMQSPAREIEYLCVAVMRLLMPDRLIPASLDVDGINGLEKRLEAGANVVTSIILPRKGLAGVSQSALDIEQDRRSVPEVEKIVANLGLCVADAEEYASWIRLRKGKIEEYQRDNQYRRGTATGHGSRLSGQAGRIRHGAH
jgi:methylornithine synthase